MDEDKKMILQKRLAELIRNSPYSRSQIAELCGTTEASLSRYVNGERMPKSEILANLATVFGTTTDYLLGNEEDWEYPRLRALVARSRGMMTREERRELSDIILGIHRRKAKEEYD